MRIYRHTSVNSFLEYSAARFPGKVALVQRKARLTYAELDGMAGRLAGTLQGRGVGRGDRVAVFMDNSVEAVVSLFAALKAGAAFMMVHPTTKAGKLEYLLHNSRAKALLAQGERADIVREIRSPFLETIIMAGAHDGGLPCMRFKEAVSSSAGIAPGRNCIDMDLASIIYTSGSTGRPKGVMLTHLNMISAAHSITSYLENTENDRIMSVLPLSFDYGLYQVLMGFLIGGTVVLEKSFAYPYETIETMNREGVTGFPGVPTIFAILLALKGIERYDFRSLRYITNTAAALPVSHIRRLREVFPYAKLFSMYGLTECKRVSYLPPEELGRRPTSVGRGMPNEEVYIVDEKGGRVPPGEVGELVVRGANVMAGYWELPEETAKCLKPGLLPGERVLHTGDLFRMDEEGFLYFVARKDDIIKCRGEKVSPKEIENVLYSLDGILEAAVFGVPDRILGQAIKACVSLEHGSKLTEKDIMRHCARHLESFMLPKHVEIRDSLPKTVTGKISKKELTAPHTTEGVHA